MLFHMLTKRAVLFFITFLFASTWGDIFDEISTLTTAGRRGFVSSPTTLRHGYFNRMEINAPPASRSMDLFKLTETEIKRSEQEWGWDKWCQLQPKVGNCSARMKVFFYDTQLDKCRQFVYSGCNGNQNKFTSLRDCEQFCKGFGLVFDERATTLEESCAMQPNPGSCISFGSKFFFDVDLRICREFIFGGCGGNANRFPDEHTCLQDCLDSGS